MPKIRVGVLRGGPSNEHEVSLETGKQIIEYLPKNKYQPLDIFISKEGKWFYQDKEFNPDKILILADAIFNGLHGYYGEDGKIQKILESHQKPYTGSRVLSSMAAMDKSFSRELFKKAGLKVAPGFAVKRQDDPKEILRKAVLEVGPPWIIKPAESGSSIGVSIAGNPYEFILALENCLRDWDKAIVEKYIKGREATVAILEGFRKNSYYPLPIIEIIPADESTKIFDNKSKYNSRTREICPGRFNDRIKNKAGEAAVLAHQALGLRHYSRIDMIVTPQDEIYVLEANSLPGLTKESLFPKAASAVGLEFPHLLDHLVELAIK